MLHGEAERLLGSTDPDSWAQNVLSQTRGFLLPLVSSVLSMMGRLEGYGNPVPGRVPHTRLFKIGDVNFENNGDLKVLSSFGYGKAGRSMRKMFE